MDIEKLMLPIAEFTEYGEVCFAHLSENGERKETLREHTELCQKYWKEIVKRKKIDEIFQEFENVYLEELSKESRNLFELMTVNIVSVHDLGKINPNFQSDKMHHKWHEEVKPDPNIGSRHSILSSVFYLDYFLGKINEMWGSKQLIKKSEAEILKDFAYIYSYIISRHHGELKEFETYMASLTGKQMEGENLGKRAKSWYMMWKENILHESGISKMRKDWKKMFGRMQKEDVKKTVYLYGLTKLLYSLLVVADYYATTEFMNGARMLDFGEIVDYEDMIDIYESGDVQKKIREYEKETYPMEKEKLEKIDEINILQATYEAMRAAIGGLSQTPDLLLNDAVTIPGMEIPQIPIVKGDAKSVSIAAASILAKVTRDHLMAEYDKLYPGYGFAKHKGYGTAAHIAALRELGPSPIHRRTFIKNFV